MFLNIIPIFVLVVVGYLLRRFNIIKLSWTKTLNNFVYFVSLPALIISGFSGLAWSNTATLNLLAQNTLIIVVFSVLVTLLLLILPIKSKQRAVILLGATMGNTVYLGVPLVSNLLPESPIITAVGVVQLVISMLCALVAIEFVFVGSRNITEIIKRICYNPLLISAIVGVSLSFIDFSSDYDGFVRIPIQMIATTASPLALIALGSFLYAHKPNKNWLQVIFATSLKLLGLPIFAYFVMHYIGQSAYSSNVTVLMSCMPVAVTAFVISEKYNLDTQFAAMTMLVSTIASVASITAIAELIV